MTETKRTHRSAEDRIAELQTKIEAIRNRADRKRARAKPEVKFALAATKALDKALAATQDATLRTTVAAAVAITGHVVAESTTKPAAATGKPRGRPKKSAA